MLFSLFFLPCSLIWLLCRFCEAQWVTLVQSVLSKSSFFFFFLLKVSKTKPGVKESLFFPSGFFKCCLFHWKCFVWFSTVSANQHKFLRGSSYRCDLLQMRSRNVKDEESISGAPSHCVVGVAEIHFYSRLILNHQHICQPSLCFAAVWVTGKYKHKHFPKVDSFCSGESRDQHSAKLRYHLTSSTLI